MGKKERGAKICTLVMMTGSQKHPSALVLKIFLLDNDCDEDVDDDEDRDDDDDNYEDDEDGDDDEEEEEGGEHPLSFSLSSISPGCAARPTLPCCGQSG